MLQYVPDKECPVKVGGRPGVLLLRVTQEDIDRGERMSASGCPVARALRREVGGEWYVGAYMASKRVTSHGDVYRMSDDTVKWVREFDARLPVEPFTATFTPRGCLPLVEN